MATLYLVATPIGNLEDITLRALRILKEAAVIFCEDARYTTRLLQHYDIPTPTMTLYEHSGVGMFEKVYHLLMQHKDVAYVTDAGTPGVSDPGGKLIEYLIQRACDTELNNVPITIVPIPGPSALTAALSVAGINLERFVFMGFPPAKNKRNKYFSEVVQSSVPVVFYESMYRLLKSIEHLAELDDTLKVIVCGELTKRYEKVYRGSVHEVVGELKRNDMRGEYVVLVYREKVHSYEE